MVAAFLTPPDAVSQSFMAVPMYLLYEVGVLLAAFLLKGKHAPQPGEAVDAGK